MSNRWRYRLHINAATSLQLPSFNKQCTCWLNHPSSNHVLQLCPLVPSLSLQRLVGLVEFFDEIQIPQLKWLVQLGSEDFLAVSFLN